MHLKPDKLLQPLFSTQERGINRQVEGFRPQVCVTPRCAGSCRGWGSAWSPGPVIRQTQPLWTARDGPPAACGVGLVARILRLFTTGCMRTFRQPLGSTEGWRVLTIAGILTRSSARFLVVLAAAVAALCWATAADAHIYWANPGLAQ
jgi:hypothetical protein